MPISVTEINIIVRCNRVYFRRLHTLLVIKIDYVNFWMGIPYMSISLIVTAIARDTRELRSLANKFRKPDVGSFIYGSRFLFRINKKFRWAGCITETGEIIGVLT